MATHEKEQTGEGRIFEHHNLGRNKNDVHSGETNTSSGRKAGQAGASYETGAGAKQIGMCTEEKYFKQNIVFSVSFQPSQMHLLFPFPKLLNQRGA